MSGDWKSTVSRRPLLAALGALAGVGIAGSILYEGTELLLRGHATGPHADLLAGLGDLNAAAVVGRAALAEMPAFEPAKAVQELHQAIGGRPLGAVLTLETGRDELAEVRGWVLPRTLAMLCALAAKPS